MSMALAQKLAADSIAAVAEGRNLQDVLAQIRTAHPDLTAQENGALQDIAYGCQRYLGSLKHMLAQMLKKPIDNPQLESLLLAALYQLHYTRNAPHAVVNEAVESIAKIGRGQYRSFANAVLRRFLREREKLASSCKKDDVAKHNLPLWWVAYLKNHYPKHWHNITAALQSHPPMTLRVNRRHGNAESYLEKLAAEGIAAKALDEYAVTLEEAVPVNRLPGFSDGIVSVQDFGAQQAAYLLNPKDGERILDACAAPGGKTGHILELADCRVTALDIDAGRLKRVEDNIARLGFQTASAACADARDLAAWYGKAFRRNPCRRAMHRFRRGAAQSRREMAAPSDRRAQNRPPAGSPAGRTLADAETGRQNAACHLFRVRRRKRWAIAKIPQPPCRCRTDRIAGAFTEQTPRWLLLRAYSKALNNGLCCCRCFPFCRTRRRRG